MQSDDGVVVGREEFLTLLGECELVSAEQLSRLEAVARAERLGADALAGEVVRNGWLTDWQADELLRGRRSMQLDRYRLLEPIGSGGMAVVYRAWDTQQARLVAVKILRALEALGPESDWLARFRREYWTAIAANHPNIVAVCEAASEPVGHGDRHYLVMEYLAGADLKRWAQEHGPLPVPVACECARQAALGLAHLHERGLVHRDVKPSNLFATFDPTRGAFVIKLLDMGFARFREDTASAITRTGQLAGTIDYLAPELVRDSKCLDPRSDLFSLGCALFEFLSGEVPYVARNNTARLLIRCRHDAPPLRSLRPELPESLEALMTELLARDPLERISSAKALIDRLTPFIAEGRKIRRRLRSDSYDPAGVLAEAFAPLRATADASGTRP